MSWELLWLSISGRAVFDSSQESLIQGFARISPLHHHEFVTNLLTRSDKLLYDWEVKDEVPVSYVWYGQCICSFLPLYKLGSKWLILSLLDCHFKCHCLDEFYLGKNCRSTGINHLYLFSNLAYLINFSLISALDFQPLSWLWGSIYSRLL